MADSGTQFRSQEFAAREQRHASEMEFRGATNLGRGIGQGMTGYMDSSMQLARLHLAKEQLRSRLYSDSVHNAATMQKMAMVQQLQALGFDRERVRGIKLQNDTAAAQNAEMQRQLELRQEGKPDIARSVEAMLRDVSGWVLSGMIPDPSSPEGWREMRDSDAPRVKRLMDRGGVPRHYRRIQDAIRTLGDMETQMGGGRLQELQQLLIRAESMDPSAVDAELQRIMSQAPRSADPNAPDTTPGPAPRDVGAQDAAALSQHPWLGGYNPQSEQGEQHVQSYYQMMRQAFPDFDEGLAAALSSQRASAGRTGFEPGSQEFVQRFLETGYQDPDLFIWFLMRNKPPAAPYEDYRAFQIEKLKRLQSENGLWPKIAHWDTSWNRVAKHWLKE